MLRSHLPWAENQNKRTRASEAGAQPARHLFFGIFQKNGQDYAEVVPDCANATRQAIIQGKVDLDSIIHSDGWRDCNGLGDLGY